MFIIYFTTICVIVVMGWCGWWLHQYSKQYKLFSEFYMCGINGDSSVISSKYELSISNDLKSQLICATSVTTDFNKRFKKNMDIIRYAFEAMLKMQIQVADIVQTDREMHCTTLVGGAAGIYVVFHFLVKGDKLELTKVDGLCSVFAKIRCFEEQR